MPKLSVYFIKAGFIYLALGFSFGSLLLAHKGLNLWPAFWLLLPLHIEYLLMGWTLQLIMGVGFWIFPRFRRSRGDERPVWIAFILLNVGLLVISLHYLAGLSPYFLVMGRLCQVVALGAFALHAWPRLKPPGASRQVSR